MSRLTLVSSWVIDRAKVTDYLLNLSHPDGYSKAKYLLAFGYSHAHPDWLARDLAGHAITCGPGREVVPPAGLCRLVIEGGMETPDGRTANVRTVWERTSEYEARFITLVPLTR